MATATTAHPPITVIAYGSLMSGRGLAGLETLAVTDAARVRLRGCRRGYGKFSQYGDRFAMVLEPLVWDRPIQATRIGADTPRGEEPEAIALELSLADLGRVAEREGYLPAAVERLAARARADGQPLAAHLWHVLEAAGFDTVGYRRALVAAIGYTSPHYVPHPVALGDGATALTFLPPGEEGSGDDAVVPIRVRSAMTRVLSVRDVWRMKPNESQLDYLVTTLVAEAHNLSLGDVWADLDEYPPLANLLRERLAAERTDEPARFRAILGLDQPTYAARFEEGPWRGTVLERREKETP